MIEQFESAGGEGKPRYGQVHVCWAAEEPSARSTALEWWPNAVVGGNLPWEVPLPSLFRGCQLVGRRERDRPADRLRPDPGPHVEAIREFVDAGYDHVYIHQVGPDQEGFFRFYERELAPRLEDLRD